MQRLRRVGAALRNNWKKSVCGGVAATYGAQWQMARLEETAYMRGLAREALSYGSQGSHVDTPSYAVTVVLNPVASGVKGRTMYEKYCAPLLNLAGFKVSVIRTESDGQAKDIMEIMKDADAVLVAGGDGTLMEAVTGLLRREDREEAAKVPLGVLPVGRTNSLAHRLFPGQPSQVRLMGEATMAVVRQLRKPVGVMEVESQAVGRKIYAVSALELGAWKDARLLLNKWFISFDWIKTYMPQLLYGRSYLTKHKEMLFDCDLELQYLESPAEEAAPKVKPVSDARGGVVAWLTGAGSTKAAEPLSPAAQWSCLESGQFHGSGLVIGPEGDGLAAQLLPAVGGIGQFVGHGAAVMRGRTEGLLEPQATVSTPGLLLTPRLEEGKDRTICVDGEDIELAGPLLVTLLKDRLSFFCDRSLVSEEPAPAARSAGAPRWSSVASLGLARGRGGH